jgi:hypothetical protein
MNVNKMDKLLAMTASSQVEEARTAAFLLCKMLREQGADLSRLVSQPEQRGMTSYDAYVRSVRKAAQEERSSRRTKKSAPEPVTVKSEWTTWAKSW